MKLLGYENKIRANRDIFKLTCWYWFKDAVSVEIKPKSVDHQWWRRYCQSSACRESATGQQLRPTHTHTHAPAHRHTCLRLCLHHTFQFQQPLLCFCQLHSHKDSQRPLRAEPLPSVQPPQERSGLHAWGDQSIDRPIDQSINQWVCQSVSQWANEWMNQSINEWMNEWLNERVCQSVSQWVSEWMKEWVSQSVNQITNQSFFLSCI